MARCARLAREPAVGPASALVGGRSAGARVACRTASTRMPAAVVCLAFPLHLPGRPEKSRVAELLMPTAPGWCCKAAKDSFGSAEEMRVAIGAHRGYASSSCRSADHGYRMCEGRSVHRR